MQTFVTLICGSGYTIDWNAIAALATAAAVIVALWIPARERRARKLERLQAEARAAQIVSQKLVSVIELMPNVLKLIVEHHGQLADNPGTDVLYGVDACNEVLSGEAFCHQLPFAHVATAELVCALARKWKQEIQTELQAQRDPTLTKHSHWHDRDHVRAIAEQLHASAKELRGCCNATQDVLADASASIFRRRINQLRRAAPYA